jgi:hypothetical protein
LQVRGGHHENINARGGHYITLEHVEGNWPMLKKC